MAWAPAGQRQGTILIANDHEWAARSLESILVPAGYRVICVFTGQQAVERGRIESLDAAFIDRQLPDQNGADVCRALRRLPHLGVSLPVLITTAGPAGRAQRIEAYEAGAWDFLAQPLESESILLKLGVYVDAKRAADGLREQTFLDQATGLYSWGGLLRRGQEFCRLAVRHHQHLSCVAVAPSGIERPAFSGPFERLVEGLARVLRRHSRETDAIGRVGPAEFGLLAVGLTEFEAGQIVGRWTAAAGRSLPLRTAIRTVRPAQIHPHDPERLVAATVAGMRADPLTLA